MDSTSLDLAMAPSGSGMPRLVPRLATLWRGTLGLYCLSLTLLMDSTSSLDLMIGPSGSGMSRLVLQLATLWRGTLVWYALLLTLLMDSTSSLDLVAIGPSGSGMP